MRIITKGATDQSVCLYVVDNSTGLPATSLAYNSSGIDLWYRREGAALTSITEATQTAGGAHSDGGFVHIANGVYRLDLPDAAVASGVDTVEVGGTITGYTVYPRTIQLSALALQTATQPVNVTQYGGSNGTFSSGRPEVNASHWGGTAVGSASVRADVISLSGDSTAADNMEADYDGTGYSKTRSSIGTLLNEQRTIYLDPATGNDANPGTKELPKDTFAGAIAIATPGDRILLMSNLSGELCTISVDNLTLEGVSPNTSITASTEVADSVITVDDGTTIRNLTITTTDGGDGGGTAVTVSNKSRITLENLTVYGHRRPLSVAYSVSRQMGGVFARRCRFTSKLHGVALAGGCHRFVDCWSHNEGGYDDGFGAVVNHTAFTLSGAQGYGAEAVFDNCIATITTDSSDIVGVQVPTQLLCGISAYDNAMVTLHNCKVNVTNGHDDFIGDIVGVLSSGAAIIVANGCHVATSEGNATADNLNDFVGNGSYHGHLAPTGQLIVRGGYYDAMKVTGAVQVVEKDVAATNTRVQTGVPNVAPGDNGGLPTVNASNQVGGIAGTINTFDELGATGNPNVLLVSEINTVGSQTSFTLVDGATFNDAYNGQTIVLYDDSNSDYPSVRIVSDYVGSTKTVTLDSAPDFTLGTDDSVRLFATAPGTAAPTAATVAGAVRTELTTELGRIDATISSRNATTPLDAAGTRAALGFASANADTQLAAITSTSATAASAATTASGVVSSGTHGNAALKTLVDGTQTTANAINTKLGTPAGASVSADIAGIEASVDLSPITDKLPTGGAKIAGEGTTAKNLDQIVAEAELSPEQITEIAEDVADAIGDVAATQPRINRKPSPGFTTKISRRTDGTYKATLPIRLTAGAVDSVYVFIDMSPLFGAEDYVETVGTAVVSGGSITAEGKGPRDTYAVVELDGTATAGEERTVTVPVTMTSGTTVPVVFDVEVFE